jgi:hypothetical protein
MEAQLTVQKEVEMSYMQQVGSRQTPNLAFPHPGELALSLTTSFKDGSAAPFPTLNTPLAPTVARTAGPCQHCAYLGLLAGRTIGACCVVEHRLFGCSAVHISTIGQHGICA